MAVDIIVDLKHRRLLFDGVTKLTSLGEITEVAVTVVATDHPFRDLLNEFRDVELPTSIKTINHDITHHIQTRGQPTATKYRQLEPDKLEAAKEEFQVIRELGICVGLQAAVRQALYIVCRRRTFNGDSWEIIDT